jgi:hypothetical protein
MTMSGITSCPACSGAQRIPQGGRNVDDSSGMTDADAAATVADFEAKVPKALVYKLKKQIADIREFNLQNLYHYGRISKKDYFELKSMYQYYVPLKGWEEGEEDEHLQNYIEDGRSSGGGARNLLREAEGRKSMADHPIYNFMHYSVSVISWEEKNREKQAAYNLAAVNRKHNDCHVLK